MQTYCSCNQNTTSSKDGENKTGNNANSSIESDIEFIGEILETFSSLDCSEHLEKEFNCQCSFGETMSTPIFISNMKNGACIKVNGQLNALYPDWEERDYKNEFKELSKAKEWISIKGDSVKYFGKPLSYYKYQDTTRFIVDVILASGRDITQIPIEATETNDLSKTMKRKGAIAILAAKEIKKNNVEDPLTIIKMDNKSYDIIVRIRKLRPIKGEANFYSGTITLLKHRDTEILETQSIVGICDC